jgi:hypothetical protein
MKLVGNWHLYEADLDSVTLSQSFLERAKTTLESSNFNFQADKNFQIVDMSFSGGSYTGSGTIPLKKRNSRYFILNSTSILKNMT